jgi:phage-related protein
MIKDLSNYEDKGATCRYCGKFFESYNNTYANHEDYCQHTAKGIEARNNAFKYLDKLYAMPEASFNKLMYGMEFSEKLNKVN